MRLEPVAAPAAPLRLREAERACAGLARREAKNFYWGFIALPRERRNAIYALYGFARQVDDEVDRPGAGAEAGLAEQRRRLRACLAGDRGDPVMVVGPDGAPVARGLSAYAAEDARRILGCRSEQIEASLGWRGRDEIIHRDDLVLL